MKVVALTGPSKLEVCDRDIPQIDDHSVLLKVKAVGVCGSDVRIYRNGDHRVTYPRVMGHEIAGEVVEKGKYVNNVQIGDRVVLGAHIPCGLCEYCQEGVGQHCVKRWSIGYQYDGGFAEYVLVNRFMIESGYICKFEEHISFEEACISEPLSCVIHGLKKLAFKPGETVTVFGAGAIGCMFVVLLRKLGAGKIIVVQRSEARRSFARSIGADVCIDPGEVDPVQHILEETHGYGSDVSIVTAASSEVQNQTLLCTKKLGRILFFSGLPKQGKVEFDTNQITYKELNIMGMHGASRGDLRETVRWLNDRFIDFSEFITHRFALHETENAFITTEKRIGIKSVVMPELNMKQNGV